MNLSDQLSGEPLRAAPGTASTRGLTLAWDLDQLTIDEAGARQVVGFADVAVQLSQSVTEPVRIKRRRRPLLRVELRGPDGLRLRLRAQTDAELVAGLPELAGRDDHTVDLDSLRVLVDAARAGGASVVQGAVELDTSADQAPRLARHHGAAAVAWFVASIGTVAGLGIAILGAMQLSPAHTAHLNYGSALLLLMLPSFGLALGLLRLRHGRPTWVRATLIAVAVAVLHLTMTQCLAVSSWLQGVGQDGVAMMLAGHSLAQLCAVILAMIPWRWSLVADDTRLTWTSGLGARHSVAWLDPVEATEAALHRETTRLLDGPAVRQLLDIAARRPTHADRAGETVTPIARRRRVGRAMVLGLISGLWALLIPSLPTEILRPIAALPVALALWGVVRALRVHLLAVDLTRGVLVARTTAWRDRVARAPLCVPMAADDFYARAPTARWTGCAVERLQQVQATRYVSGGATLGFELQRGHAHSLRSLFPSRTTGDHDAQRVERVAEQIRAALD